MSPLIRLSMLKVVSARKLYVTTYLTVHIEGCNSDRIFFWSPPIRLSTLKVWLAWLLLKFHHPVVSAIKLGSFRNMSIFQFIKWQKNSPYSALQPLLLQFCPVSRQLHPPPLRQRLRAALLVRRRRLERRVGRAQARVLRCCWDVVVPVGLVVDALPPEMKVICICTLSHLGQFSLSVSFRTLGCFRINFLGSENHWFMTKDSNQSNIRHFPWWTRWRWHFFTGCGFSWHRSPHNLDRRSVWH